MSAPFQQKKNNILHRLALDSPDASPKGYVDEEIWPLVEQLNKHSGIVTTSSCAGRLAVFLEGIKKSPDTPQLASIGGKGLGGQWIFVSHTPVQNGLLSWQNLSGETIHGYLCCGEGQGVPTHSNAHSINEESRFLHFKFEPMILHIMTDKLELAHSILRIALSSGFRESGIMNPAVPTTLAIRTTGLAFDCIIGHYDTRTQKVCQTVDDAYLAMLVSLANSRFKENEKRRVSFSRAVRYLLEGTVDSSLAPHPTWEDSETRRERMKSEGLQKKLKKSQIQGSSPPGTENIDEEPFDFDHLLALQ